VNSNSPGPEGILSVDLFLSPCTLVNPHGLVCNPGKGKCLIFGLFSMVRRHGLLLTGSVPQHQSEKPAPLFTVVPPFLCPLPFRKAFLLLAVSLLFSNYDCDHGSQSSSLCSLLSWSPVTPQSFSHFFSFSPLCTGHYFLIKV